MTTIVTRAGKGSRLTTVEMDANLTNLNNDKLEVSTAASTYQPLDGDLTAIAALATTGYAKRTGTNTWAISATVAGSDITGAIDGVTVGITTPAAARVTTMLINASAFLGTEKLRVIGDVAISGAVSMLGVPIPDQVLTIGPGIHPSAAASVYGVGLDITAPTTTIGNFFNFYSFMRSTAAAYTITTMTHFQAWAVVKGAGSTITTARGFHADSTLANATNNYGFSSNIASAANTYQLYMSGTAANYLASDLRIGTTSLVGSEKLRVAGSTNTDTLVVNTLATINPSSLSAIDNTTIGVTTPVNARFSYVGVGIAGDSRYSVLAVAPPSTGTTLQIYGAVATAPSTATSALWGYTCDLRTTAAAFTLTDMFFFSAHNGTLGATSTVTNVTGFRILAAAAIGTNNFGYVSTITAATNNYGLYFTGTAKNYINGEVGIKATPSTNIALSIATPTGTGTSVWGTFTSVVGPTTSTSNVFGHDSNLATTAAAYVTSNVIHFQATQTTKGAGSTITSSYGFVAGNSIAVGTNNYGFFSSIASAAATYQLFMNGTAQSYFGGNVVMLNGTTFGWGVAGTPDTTIERASSGILEQKNAANAQTYRIYGTTTGPKYLSLSHDGTNAIVDTNASGGRLSLGGNASSIFGLSHLLFTDNTFDIGASGVTRPRSGYFSASITVGTSFIVGSNQVVGGRDTGWSAMTGTTNKATVYDTATVTLAQLAGRVMAIQAALTTHGLLGA